MDAQPYSRHESRSSSRLLRGALHPFGHWVPGLQTLCPQISLCSHCPPWGTLAEEHRDNNEPGLYPSEHESAVIGSLDYYGVLDLETE